MPGFPKKYCNFRNLCGNWALKKMEKHFLAKIVTLLWHTLLWSTSSKLHRCLTWYKNAIFLMKDQLPIQKINTCGKRVSEVCSGLRQGKERDYFLDSLILFYQWIKSDIVILNMTRSLILLWDIFLWKSSEPGSSWLWPHIIGKPNEDKESMLLP